MAKFFINRPIVAMVISIVMVIVGVVAMVQLPIAQYPELAPPEILVQATYVGADALTLEQSVATPIEQQMQGVDNMIYMNSVNDSTGLMRLRVTFDVGTDPKHRPDPVADALSRRPSRSSRSMSATRVSRSASRPPPRWRCSLCTRPRELTTTLSSSNYAYININDPMSRVPGVGQVRSSARASTRCVSGCGPTR